MTANYSHQLPTTDHSTYAQCVERDSDSPRASTDSITVCVSMQKDSGGEGPLRTLALAVEAIWPSYVHWKQICDMMIDLQPFEIILGTSVVERF